MAGPASTNPFEYGGVVGRDAFCNRLAQRDDLVRAAENGERLFVYAERRMGKTSLIRQVMEALDPARFVPVYIDLWPTDGIDAFATAAARAYAHALERRADRLLEKSKALFSRLQPSLVLDETGNPSVQFGVRSASERIPALEEVLAAPVKLADRSGKRIVVVFDEFQQILDYEDDLVERSLRSEIQHQKNISYFFLGSRKHLIERLFSDSRRPLYRSAGHYPLGPIETSHWMPFIEQRFARTGKPIDEGTIQSLCLRTEGHPFYTQQLAHALWEGTPSGHAVARGALDTAVDLLLRRENYAFTIRWESLTRNQQRMLRGLATAEPDEPFSAAFVQEYGLGSPSSAQRAAASLLKLDLIDREDRTFVVTDRFFRLWIRKKL